MYYDLVSVCVMCKQFIQSENDGLSRYMTNHPKGPIRKTSEEVGRDKDMKMIQLIREKERVRENKKEQGVRGGKREENSSKSSSKKEGGSSGSAKQDGVDTNSKEEDEDGGVVITVRVG
jgi:hypothetical protein